MWYVMMLRTRTDFFLGCGMQIIYRNPPFTWKFHPLLPGNDDPVLTNRFWQRRGLEVKAQLANGQVSQGYVYMTLDAVTCSGIHLDILHLGEALACLLEEMMLGMFGVRYYFSRLPLSSCWVAWHSDESLGFFGCFRKPAISPQLKWEDWLCVFLRFAWYSCLANLSEGSHPQCEDTLMYPNVFVLKSSAHFFPLFEEVHVYVCTCVDNHPI